MKVWWECCRGLWITCGVTGDVVAGCGHTKGGWPYVLAVGSKGAWKKVGYQDLAGGEPAARLEPDVHIAKIRRRGRERDRSINAGEEKSAIGLRITLVGMTAKVVEEGFQGDTCDGRHES